MIVGTTCFLFGQSTNTSVDKQLHREHLEYGDIIQFSFYDTYRNLQKNNGVLMGINIL